MVVAVLSMLVGQAMGATNAVHLTGSALLGLGASDMAAKISYIPMYAVREGLMPEIWANTIEEQLYAENGFMKLSQDHGAYINAQSVHLPQAGTAPKVTKNRKVGPAANDQRTDDVLTYSLNRYYVQPRVIEFLDELQTNYPLRSSTMAHSNSALHDRIAVETLIAWAATNAAKIVRTSGAAGTANAPTGATGVRKLVTTEDIRSLAMIMDNDNVPSQGRYLMMDTYMYYELFGIDHLLRKDYMNKAALPSGVIDVLFGFNIMMRTGTPVYTNAGTPAVKPLSDEGVATAAAADNRSCTAWHPSFVAQALGDINVFINEKDANNFGTVFSANLLHGASKTRTDQKGVVSLVQAPTS